METLSSRTASSVSSSFACVRLIFLLDCPTLLTSSSTEGWSGFDILRTFKIEVVLRSQARNIAQTSGSSSSTMGPWSEDSRSVEKISSPPSATRIFSPIDGERLVTTWPSYHHHQCRVLQGVMSSPMTADMSSPGLMLSLVLSPSTTTADWLNWSWPSNTTTGLQILAVSLIVKRINVTSFPEAWIRHCDDGLIRAKRWGWKSQVEVWVLNEIWEEKLKT